jgi:hypothetical protein
MITRSRAPYVSAPDPSCPVKSEEPPNWQVLSDVPTQELVCAHVWAVGGEVVVGDDVIDRLGVVSEDQQRLREMARTSVRLLSHADSRVEIHDESMAQDPDIGEWDNEWERARLAHKLRFDFRMTLAETAGVLNAAKYTAKPGREHSGSSVQRLLADHAKDLSLQSSSSVRTPGRGAALEGLALVTFGPEARVLVPAASRYNAGLSRPLPHVLELPQWGDLERDLQALVMGFKAMLFGAVYVSSASALGGFVLREALYGQVWRYGIRGCLRESGRSRRAHRDRSPNPPRARPIQCAPVRNSAGSRCRNDCR